MEGAGMKGFDRAISLEELEQMYWGEPNFESSLVVTCHRLRRKPLKDFTVEDLRIMIGQQISLSYLAPLAVERLEDDPLAEADFGPGDLLQVTLQLPEVFWSIYPDSFQRVRQIIRRIKESLPSLDEP